MYYMHNILGLIVTGVTIYTCLEMFAYSKWSPTLSVHSVLGILALVLLFLTGVSGIATAFMMGFYNSDPEWAAKDKVYNVAKAHRYISYVMLLWGNALVTGGTWTYLEKIGFDPWGPVALVEITFFGLLWVFHECILRRYNRKNFKIIEGNGLKSQLEHGDRLKNRMTPAEIEEAVAEGDSLCICDNLVLRTDGYERIHPGGKFVITKNFGRDIAKFYYGNYGLTRLFTLHTHSGQANQILHNMIIGTIVD